MTMQTEEGRSPLGRSRAPRLATLGTLSAMIAGLSANVFPGAALGQSSETFQYDALGRLTAVERSDHSSTAYAYDAAGNRATLTAVDLMENQWEAEALPHQIGYAIPGGWGASAGNGPGIMTYGPYTPSTPVGLNVATWRVRVDSHTFPDSGEAVKLDVYDATAGVELGSRQLKRSDWAASESYQYFELPFALVSASNGHQLEFRTWYSGLATVGVDVIGTRRVGSAWAMNDPAIYHNGGSATADGWGATTAQAAAHITYGPYMAAPAGARRAVWRMKIDDNTSPDVSPIVTIDIWDATASEALGAVTLERQDWVAANQFQLFEIPFILDASRAGHLLEYRTFHHANGNVVVNWVGLR